MLICYHLSYIEFRILSLLGKRPKCKNCTNYTQKPTKHFIDEIRGDYVCNLLKGQHNYKTVYYKPLNWQWCQYYNKKGGKSLIYYIDLFIRVMGAVGIIPIIFYLIYLGKITNNEGAFLYFITFSFALCWSIKNIGAPHEN